MTQQRRLQSVAFTSKVGVDMGPVQPGFWIGAVAVDNPTLSWLSIIAGSGVAQVPPLTLGYVTNLGGIGASSVTIKFGAAPFGAALSLEQGAQITAIFYEFGSGIGNSYGSSIVPNHAVLPTVFSLNGATPGSVDNVQLIAGPGVGLRIRFFEAKITDDAFNDPTGGPFSIGYKASGIFTDDPEGPFIASLAWGARHQRSDQITIPGGIPLGGNKALIFRLGADTEEQIFWLTVYYTIELAA
jgi:hypothetical protein